MRPKGIHTTANDIDAKAKQPIRYPEVDGGFGFVPRPRMAYPCPYSVARQPATMAGVGWWPKRPLSDFGPRLGAGIPDVVRPAPHRASSIPGSGAEPRIGAGRQRLDGVCGRFRRPCCDTITLLTIIIMVCDLWRLFGAV